MILLARHGEAAVIAEREGAPDRASVADDQRGQGSRRDIVERGVHAG